MNLRIKEIAKRKGVSMKLLSERLGLSYQGFNQKLLRNPTLKFIEEVAVALECSTFELLEPTDDSLYHVYDQDGKWRGVTAK